MIFCYLYIHVYESVNSLQRLWFVKVTNESALVLLPEHDQYVCLQKDSYGVLSWWLFVSYEWYNSCHSKQSRLLCRECHCNTYIHYVFCYCLFKSIYTLKIHLSRWEGCYHISVRPRKVICHGFLRLRICVKRYLLII